MRHLLTEDAPRFRGRTLVAFAHYDSAGLVQPDVVYHVAALAEEIATDLVFVSNSPLRAVDRELLEGLSSPLRCEVTVIERENTGFDFSAWKAGLAHMGTYDYERVILTNSSIIGPYASIGRIASQMSGSGADVWGLTSSLEMGWHLQSYFLGFERAILRHRAFADFWEGVEPSATKWDVVTRYETKLAAHFRANGAIVEAAFVMPLEAKLAARTPSFENVSMAAPRALLRAGFPYVKRMLFRSNPADVNVEELRAWMREQAVPFSPEAEVG